MVRFTFAVGLAFAVLTIVVAEELYSDKYDHIDLMAILENENIRLQYYNCFMDTGPCVTEDAKYFKDRFPEAVVTKCRKCTAMQKDRFGVMVAWYTENQLAEWETLVAKLTEDAKKSNISA